MNQDETGSSEKPGALLDKWAADAFVQFVSRSDGPRTTTTVSRDALLLLVERAVSAERERKISGIYGLEVESSSRGMFVARLENMQKNGDQWLTIAAVLALLNDCDMLAQRPNSGTTSPGL